MLAKYVPEAGLPSTICFRLRGTGKPETLTKIRRLLEVLHPHRQPEMWVSLDGTQFVSVSALERARQQGKPQVVSRNQDIVEIKPYQMFLQLSELEETQHAFPDPATSPRRIRIFISYSHPDETPYKERLNICLKNLQRKLPIDFWDDRDLFVGMPWEAEILKQLDQADFVCLLISPDFFASDYCFSREMEGALAKYKQGKEIPIPILIRATSDWEQFPIGRHQTLPTPAKPLAQ